MKASADEIVICLMARLLTDAGVVGVGSSSPMPAAGALLAQYLCPGRTRALIFRNNVNDPFHESGSELYDRISQGRVDVFFIGGGQIDGNANLNNVGVGLYPRTQSRFPGSFGTPFIIGMVPRVILYREEHSPRVLVPKVDFVSAAGVTPPHMYRRGGPTDLITSKAHFIFDRAAGRFALASVHPPHTATEVHQATGFEYDHPDIVRETEAPTGEMLHLLRSEVRAQVSETYPEFAATRLQGPQ
ncbi:CoA-transferase [Ramlibacter sp. AN1133]|uniref:CoA-transferase n=1 Tax=Ramlibacter sp. AN1133 TaxID=3133429 RepID=UPI0030C158D9